MRRVVSDRSGRLHAKIATGVVAMCVVGCGQPSATEVDVLVQESSGPANIVWIVVDQLVDGGDVDYEALLREGVRVPTGPVQGTTASYHSSLLTGIHPTSLASDDGHLAGSLPSGVMTLPERLRRADTRRSRTGHRSKRCPHRTRAKPAGLSHGRWMVHPGWREHRDPSRERVGPWHRGIKLSARSTRKRQGFAIAQGNLECRHKARLEHCCRHQGLKLKRCELIGSMNPK